MPKPIPVFVGDVDAAGERLTLQAPSDWKRYLKGLAGKRLDLSLRVRKSKRSIDQNAYIWGVAYPVIAEHLGYDAHEHERLHYDLLAIRFGTVAQSSLLKGAPPRIVPAKTSSELNTEEFSSYMEWLIRYAATEFGCVVPLPGEAVAA